MDTLFFHYVFYFILLGAGYFLGSYLNEKGKNRAVKEDIEALTRKVEDIKTENATKLEDITQQNRLILAQGEWKNQLRLAAIDKRLEVHQKAYSLLRKFMRILSNDEQTNKALFDECQDWWDNNSLYLTSKARSKFGFAWETTLETVAVLPVYRLYRSKVIDEREVKRQEEVKKKVFVLHRAISEAVQTVIEEVQLPSLAEDTKLPIEQGNQNQE